MASAEAVAAVVEAGGAHVPGLMDALEDRLRVIAASHGATLGENVTPEYAPLIPIRLKAAKSRLTLLEGV